ncbi:Endonuclease-reverse transcriptase, partial [Operophtera brumata]
MSHMFCLHQPTDDKLGSHEHAISQTYDLPTRNAEENARRQKKRPKEKHRDTNGDQGHILSGIDKWCQRVTAWYPRVGKRSRGRQYKRGTAILKTQQRGYEPAKRRGKWKELEAHAGRHRQKQPRSLCLTRNGLNFYHIH